MKILKPNILFVIILFISCNSNKTKKSEVVSASSDIVSTSENNKDTKKKIKKAFKVINEQDKLFGIASAKIVFQYSGGWTGNETVWFDHFGKRVVIDQDIYYSKKNHQKVRIIWAGSKEGSLTCEYLRYGEEVNNCFEPFMRSKDTELSLFAHGDEKQLHYGYDKLGPKKFLGKEAQGWKSKSGEITGWIWKGIDVAYNNQGVEKTMLSIKEIDAIPETLLKIPEGFSMD